MLPQTGYLSTPVHYRPCLQHGLLYPLVTLPLRTFLTRTRSRILSSARRVLHEVHHRHVMSCTRMSGCCLRPRSRHCLKVQSVTQVENTPSFISQISIHGACLPLGPSTLPSPRRKPKFSYPPQVHPACTRPAFAQHPSLPSLQALASTTLIHVGKVSQPSCKPCKLRAWSSLIMCS